MSNEIMLPALIDCRVGGPGYWSSYRAHSDYRGSYKKRNNCPNLNLDCQFAVWHNGRVDIIRDGKVAPKTGEIIGRGMRGRLIRRPVATRSFTTGLDFIGLALDEQSLTLLSQFERQLTPDSKPDRISRLSVIDGWGTGVGRIAGLFDHPDVFSQQQQKAIGPYSVNDFVSAVQQQEYLLVRNAISMCWIWGSTHFQDRISDEPGAAQWIEQQLGPDQYDALIVTLPPRGLIT